MKSGYRTFLTDNKVLLHMLVIISVIPSLIINVRTEDMTEGWSEFDKISFYVTKSSRNGFDDPSSLIYKYLTESVTPSWMEDRSYEYPVTRAQPIRMETESSPIPSSTEPILPECGPVRVPVHTIDGTKVTIEWQPPSDDKHCNGIYLITILDFDDDKVIENSTVTDLKFEISSLEPCGNYKYTIIPFDNNNTSGEPNEKSFKIEAVAPSVVKNFRVTSSSTVENASTHVVVNWDEPEFGKKCVKDYEVLMWRRDRDSEEQEPNIIEENTTATAITRSELTACEVYVLQVTAIVNASMRGEPAKLTTTMEARLTVAPSKTERESYGPTFLNLSTINMDVKSVCYPSIAQFQCTYEGNDTEAEKVGIPLNKLCRNFFK